jgi:transcriptional regulator with XRE-family HTH domain
MNFLLTDIFYYDIVKYERRTEYLINDRIKLIRKHPKISLTQEAFGERIGLKKSSLSLIEHGINNVTQQTILSICREFNVNENWLKYGEGDMFITLTHDEEVAMYVQDMLDDTDDEISELIKDFIVVYQKQDDASKQVLRKLANDLYAQYQKKE